MNTDYQKQGRDFLEKYQIKFDAVMIDKCPEWKTPSEKLSKEDCPKCGTIHGQGWKITLSKGEREKLSFPFWDSWAKARKAVNRLGGEGIEIIRVKNPPAPTPYDVLACISGDIYCPTPFKAFCAEYGYEYDSRSAEKIYFRCMEFALELQRFFTDAEISDLQEIQ